MRLIGWMMWSMILRFCMISKSKKSRATVRQSKANLLATCRTQLDKSKSCEQKKLNSKLCLISKTGKARQTVRQANRLMTCKAHLMFCNKWTALRVRLNLSKKIMMRKLILFWVRRRRSKILEKKSRNLKWSLKLFCNEGEWDGPIEHWREERPKWWATIGFKQCWSSNAWDMTT